MGAHVTSFRFERRRRIHAEIARVREMHRLQVLDLADSDAAIATLEDELKEIENAEPATDASRR